MLCEKPFVRGTAVYPCGGCMPCRFNRRRLWTHRIMLEATQHGDNTFVTLTYSDANLPAGASLNAKHLQDWLKVIRGRVAPARLRFYAVGEYGDNTGRPHYHVALFGYPNCLRGQTFVSQSTGRCCEHCDLVRETWGLGKVYLGSLEVSSAQYIAGYVTKKLTRRDDPRLINADGFVRDPEFCRMSLRPGIGCHAMDEVASELMRFNLDTTQADVPVSLQHGKRKLPLGRYLRRQLRLRIGKDAKAPEVVTEQKKEMQALYEVHLATPGRASFKSRVLDKYAGRRASFHARSLIFKQRKRI